MMKILPILVFSVSVQAGVHWSYLGKTAPEHWAELGYSFCAGKNQSPVNMNRFIKADLPPLQIHYLPHGGDEVINNGHTVQINDHAHGSLEIDGQTFELLQFHFHSPSENQLNGHVFPMEAHFVHRNAQGELAVLAVFFEEGEYNAALDNIWQAMPMHEGESHRIAHQAAASAQAILPKNKAYYRFNGSLTTPPCTEGVRWLVLKQSVSLSKEQLEKFRQAMHEDNNRPVQPLNARVILQ